MMLKEMLPLNIVRSEKQRKGLVVDHFGVEWSDKMEVTVIVVRIPILVSNFLENASIVFAGSSMVTGKKAISYATS